MSITPTQQSRHLAARFTLASAAVLGLVGGPVAWAAPAAASTSERGCTVDPLKPKSTGDSDEVDFRIWVECHGNKTVEIRQLRFEEDDGGHDDFLGRSKFRESFDNHDGSEILHSRDTVDVDRHDSEEVYHYVSFRVASGNSDNWSDWTDWEKSDVATIED